MTEPMHPEDKEALRRFIMRLADSGVTEEPEMIKTLFWSTKPEAAAARPE